MSLFEHISPRRALGDLGTFLRTRKRYQIWMLLPSALIVGFIIFAFFKDSQFFPEYKPNITYVQNWPLDRSDAEITAQQAIDKVKIEERKAELEKKQKARQEEFKKVDSTLKGWGL